MFCILLKVIIVDIQSELYVYFMLKKEYHTKENLHFVKCKIRVKHTVEGYS